MGERVSGIVLGVTLYILISLPLVQAMQLNFADVDGSVPKSETVVVAGQHNDSMQNAEILNYKTMYAFGESENAGAWRKVNFEKGGTVVLTLDYESGSEYNVAVYNECSGKNYCETYEFGNYKVCVANVQPGLHFFEVTNVSGNGQYYLDVDLIEGQQQAEVSIPKCVNPVCSRCAYGCTNNKCDARPAPSLQCPTIEIGQDYDFTWDKGDYSKTYLQIGYDQQFKRSTYRQIRSKTGSLSVQKYYKTMLKYEAKAQNKQLYARVYAKDATGKIGYSNICQFGLEQPIGPTLNSPIEDSTVNADQTFYWSKGSYSKFRLQIGTEQAFGKRSYKNIGNWTKNNSIEIKRYWKTVEKLIKKDNDGILWWRVQAKDEYGGTTETGARSFSTSQQELVEPNKQNKNLVTAALLGCLPLEQKDQVTAYFAPAISLLYQWRDEIKLTDNSSSKFGENTNSARFPKIAADNEGNIAIVWENEIGAPPL